MYKQIKQLESYNKILCLFVIVLTCIFFVLYLSPFLWVLLIAIKPPGITFAIPPVWNFKPTLEHFKMLFTSFGLQTYIKNSLIVLVSSVTLTMSIGLLAGYAFARFQKNSFLLGIIFFSRIVPPMVLLLPLFVLGQKLGLSNTRIALILSYQFFLMPVAVWLLKGYFSSIPIEIEESAIIDGASHFQILIYIVMPIAKPGLAATILLCSIFCWNEFLFPLVLTTTPASKVLTVVLPNFLSDYGIEWGPLAAATMVVVIPLLILSISFKNFLIEGITEGVGK